MRGIVGKDDWETVFNASKESGKPLLVVFGNKSEEFMKIQPILQKSASLFDGDEDVAIHTVDEQTDDTVLSELAVFGEHSTTILVLKNGEKVDELKLDHEAFTEDTLKELIEKWK